MDEGERVCLHRAVLKKQNKSTICPLHHLVFLVAASRFCVQASLSWDSDMVLRAKHAALVAAYDPRPGHTNPPAVRLPVLLCVCWEKDEIPRKTARQADLPSPSHYNPPFFPNCRRLT